MMNKKVHPIITIDPVSGKKLQVTRLENFDSGIVIEGVFNLSKFNYLTTEQLYFIEVFIKNRGSIKQIEKEMDISYPTVKKLLDEVIVGLGYNVDEVNEPIIEEKTKDLKSLVLKQVEEGLLTVEKAFEKLNKMGE